MMICNDIKGFIFLKPAYYRFLKKISLTRCVSKEGCGRFNVEIIVSKVSGDVVEDLRIRCTNAFDISVGNIDTVSGLQIDIKNVRDRQLEGAAYKVEESEEGAFSFYCENFFVELLSL